MFTDERNKKKEEKTRGAKLQNLISIKKRRALNKQHAKNAKLLTRLHRLHRARHFLSDMA